MRRHLIGIIRGVTVYVQIFMRISFGRFPNFENIVKTAGYFLFSVFARKRLFEYVDCV
jgi:hypothetical protein